MLGLEKSLVYFSTSLKGNESVLEKLLQLGVEEDDTIRIGEYEFDYVF